MKRVGIMSMQRIYNYGSFLQAYGLKRLIEEIDETALVSFIDYRPGEVLIKEGVKQESNSKIMRIVSKLNEYSKVDATLINKIRFFNHKRTYAKRFYLLLGVTENLNHSTELDVQVIGSDEVFNSVQSNVNVGYSRDLYGHNSKAKKLISYAGSFGNTTIKKLINYGIKDEVAADFKKFDAISVRDMNSYKIVTELTGNEPNLNVDPALAYEYMLKESKIPKERLFSEKYIIVYGYSGRLGEKENADLKKFSENLGAKILCFGGVQGCCDEFIDCSPFELLAYFRDAEAIITDTFHGTIFSIINEKPFATIIRKSEGDSYGNEEKLGFLLEMMKLSERRVINDDILAVFEQSIDYTKTNIILNKERQKSRDYLSDALSEFIYNEE